MSTGWRPQVDEVPLSGLRPVYEHLHANPELSFAEHQTAALVAGRLRELGWQVTEGIGGTGVAGVLRNGPGPVVALRADMDALPVRETTGLPYASTVETTLPGGVRVPVMHACGHDVHVTCLIGAAELLTARRGRWQGTVLALFQPAEETAAGAQAMVDDRLFDRVPRPDVVLGQHVDERPAGTIGIRPGITMAAADSLRVRVVGKGGHASRPQATVDPVVAAASMVVRLQTVVSREVAPFEFAVVTVATFHAGEKENVIPEEAVFTVNVRTIDAGVRERVLAAIRRIVAAEAVAAGVPRPPEITDIHAFPLTVNAEQETAALTAAFADTFGADQVHEVPLKAGSEDFTRFATAVGAPSVFWFLGSSDPDRYAAAHAAGTASSDIPAAHSPRFAPVFEPTVTTGVRALVTATLAWLRERAS